MVNELIRIEKSRVKLVENTIQIIMADDWHYALLQGEGDESMEVGGKIRYLIFYSTSEQTTAHLATAHIRQSAAAGWDILDIRINPNLIQLHHWDSYPMFLNLVQLSGVLFWRGPFPFPCQYTL